MSPESFTQHDGREAHPAACSLVSCVELVWMGCGSLSFLLAVGHRAQDGVMGCVGGASDPGACRGSNTVVPLPTASHGAALCLLPS